MWRAALQPRYWRRISYTSTPSSSSSPPPATVAAALKASLQQPPQNPREPKPELSAEEKLQERERIAAERIQQREYAAFVQQLQEEMKKRCAMLHLLMDAKAMDVLVDRQEDAPILDLKLANSKEHLYSQLDQYIQQFELKLASILKQPLSNLDLDGSLQPSRWSSEDEVMDMQDSLTEDEEFQETLTDLDEKQIPTFYHLGWPELEAHALALNGAILPWSTPSFDHIFRFKRHEWVMVHDAGTSHPGVTKVSVKVDIRQLQFITNLTDDQLVKLRYLVGPRLKGNTLRLVADRYPNWQLNKQYLKQLIHTLVTEAKKPDTEIEEATSSE
eukprot:m.121108 g.121108  ORF g.121108 m.121108 type:complete len:330 (-) comp23267_c0_seq8:645-1634(-)